MTSSAGGGGGGGFGGARSARRPQGVPRGYDLETQVIIELEDVYEGCERDVVFSRLDVCDSCTGTGAKEGAEPASCETCDGRGKVMQQGLGGMFRIATNCPRCGGRGRIITDPCRSCRGKGRTPTERQLKVKIPAGVHDGQAVRIKGEGEPPGQELSSGGEGIRGDLHVVVRVREHEFFQREGDHLVLEMPISFTQAALGAEIEAPTLDGPATLKIDKGTQYGAIRRIKGRGLPNLRSGDAGDLIVALKIETPTRLSDKQKQLLREFAETEDVNVLPESHGFIDRLKDMFSGPKADRSKMNEADEDQNA